MKMKWSGILLIAIEPCHNNVPPWFRWIAAKQQYLSLQKTRRWSVPVVKPVAWTVV